VPTVRRIIVGVHGSPGSLQALRFAADEARQRDVSLLAITAWVPPGGDVAERRHPSPYLRKLWREAAWERLVILSARAAAAGADRVTKQAELEALVAFAETHPAAHVLPS